MVKCIYAFQLFGLDSNQIPISSSTGKLKTKHHPKWLEFCHLKEDSIKNHGGRLDNNDNRKRFNKIIECPNQEDMLFGWDCPIMRHHGNTLLWNIVQSKLDKYSNVKSKKEAADVTWSVVLLLKGKFGAHFWKKKISKTMFYVGLKFQINPHDKKSKLYFGIF